MSRSNGRLHGRQRTKLLAHRDHLARIFERTGSLYTTSQLVDDTPDDTDLTVDDYNENRGWYQWHHATADTE